MPAPRPTEYTPGQPLERYSAERRRRGVAAESAAYGGAAAATGLAGTTLGNAKIAGTRVGQHTLTAAEARLRASGHPAAEQVARVKRAGVWAAKRPRATAAGVGALALATGAAGAMSRIRANEEAGISQGVGRIKAGEAYDRTKRHALSKGLLRTALMASDADFNDPRLRRALTYVNNHPKKIAGVTAGAGGGVTLVSTGVGAKNRAKQTHQLRQVSKMNRLLLAEHFGTPKKTAATLGRNPQLVAFGGAGAAANLSGNPALDRRRSERQKTKRDHASRKVYGGIAGQAAYQGAMYSSNAAANRKHDVIYADPARRRGYKDPQMKRVMEGHKSKYGLKNPNVPSDHKGFFRNMPDSVPGAKHLRVNAHLASGKTGFALGSAATIGGAMIADRGGRGRKQHVGKALYQREERISPIRATGFLAGGALAAWGGGRSKMIGSALGRGVKMASSRDNHRAVQALQMAQSFQGILARGTAPGERALRQVQLVDHAVRAVPQRIRPEVALSAGLLLAGRSVPVRREHYKPVSRPIPVRPMGW